MKYRVGIIGCGKMGASWLRAFAEDDSHRWDVACVCDINPENAAAAKRIAPGAAVVDDAQSVFDDPGIDVVGLFTLCDQRANQIRRALAAGKHILCEKPIADTVAEEEKLLAEIEASDRLVAVNMFNRNAWYHHEALAFIAAGEIGKLAAVRVNHVTAGSLPGEGYEPEGPPFHNCGMHYVDVARWYADSEFQQWHAQGLRMWGEDEPWWVTAHGTFENGVVFEVTNGFVYAHAAQDKLCNCSLEAMGTLGVVRYQHDFINVELQMHGVNQTIDKTGPYGGKKQDVMVKLFADSLDAQRDLGLPSARDSVIASRVSQQMHDAAAAASPPVIGGPADLQRIKQHRNAQ